MPKAETAGTELEQLQAVELELAEEQAAEFDQADLIVPILKLGQPLTDEVTSGDAQAGEFINALTREPLGTEIEFIVAKYEKGRFYVDDDGRAFVASGATIPESWADAVGPQFVGTPFSEYPDAEEKYRERVNAKEIDWGSGPQISTTYNFTGYVAGNDVPVRLSLMRTAVPAARKWQTLLRVNRGRPTWDQVFQVTSDAKENKRGKGTFYVPVVKAGRKTKPEERQLAVELALALRSQNVQQVGHEADPDGEAIAEPKGDSGGISVD